MSGISIGYHLLGQEVKLYDKDDKEIDRNTCPCPKVCKISILLDQHDTQIPVSDVNILTCEKKYTSYVAILNDDYFCSLCYGNAISKVPPFTNRVTVNMSDRSIVKEGKTRGSFSNVFNHLTKCHHDRLPMSDLKVVMKLLQEDFQSSKNIIKPKQQPTVFEAWGKVRDESQV